MGPLKRAEMNRWLSALAAQVIFDHIGRTPPNPANRRGDDPGGLEAPAPVGSQYAGVLGSWTAVAPFVGELPRPQQEVVRLHLAEGLSYGKIAARLGLPLGTVHSRIARARKHVRFVLRRHEQWVASRVSVRPGLGVTAHPSRNESRDASISPGTASAAGQRAGEP